MIHEVAHQGSIYRNSVPAEQCNHACEIKSGATFNGNRSQCARGSGDSFGQGQSTVWKLRTLYPVGNKKLIRSAGQNPVAFLN